METNSKFDRTTNVNNYADGIIAFKNLKRNRKKIKVGNFHFSKEDFKALSDESQNATNSKGVRVVISLNDNNEITVLLEVMYEPGAGPVPGPGVGTSPKS